MSFDAQQRRTFTRLIKELMVDNGFTENAITDDIGTTIGEASDNAARAASAGTVCGHVRIQQPIAAELVSIVADVAITAVALTIAAQPAYPRKLQIRKTDANSSYAATLTIVGVGPGGEAVTEVVSLLAVDGTHTYTTSNAFASVTSATVSALSGNAAGDNIGIGVATAFGLPIPSGATSVSVYKAAVSTNGATTAVDEAVGTVDATARTIVPTTAADGTKSFDFWFKYVMPTHDHTA